MSTVQAPRTINVTRYVTPLREGGSLPALVEADDDGLYVLKFRGAGQGAKALIAELVSGEIARAIGLRVPEIVFANLNPDLARTEPDPEIHALIHDSAGLNLAIDFLPGASTFDPVVERPDPELASRVVWFDAYVTNVDRTARNTNLLIWHRNIWLIDHGATLYMHHSPGWHDDAARARAPFAGIREHVLLRHAAQLGAVDERSAASLPSDRLEAIVAMIPESWLAADSNGVDPAVARAAYVRYLTTRLESPRAFVEEAARVR
ncbi:MAG TPA: HipA family kinase [Vicinamibacterales bacterium]|nr:HipA family kinase [Vicinamibacterales bacterium]